MIGIVGCDTISPEAKQRAEIMSQLDEVVSGHAAKGFNGSVLVANKCRVLLEKGYGMADFEQKQPNAPETVFNLASVSKQFTAMSIMMLRDKGLLDIEDPLSKYISDYPDGDQITIKNLLSHTSGIPEYTTASFVADAADPRSVEELIALFQNEPLQFVPGSQYQYCNSNYVLLGYIIEKVSGTAYADFVQNNIFKPLNMNSSGYDDGRVTAKSRAIGYKSINPTATPADPFDMSNAYAAGALYSTVQDMYKWDRALCTDQLVKQETINEMFTPYKDGYALGWHAGSMEGQTQQHAVVYHDGAVNGFATYIVRGIKEDSVIIILSNVQGQNFKPMISDIYGVLETVQE
jgi:CubicO group peptidase (beta-lactamase class C family)